MKSASSSDKGDEKVDFGGPSDHAGKGSRVGGSTIFIKSAGPKKSRKSELKWNQKLVKILRKSVQKHVRKIH